MELQEISDRLEITDLITAYTRAVDRAQWDDLDDVFTADAVLDYSSVGGPCADLAQAKPFIRNLEGFERWQHTLGQVEISVDGDSAKATAYFINPMVSKGADGSETLWEVGGYYHHDLVRTPVGWRSKKLVDEFVWSRG